MRWSGSRAPTFGYGLPFAGHRYVGAAGSVVDAVVEAVDVAAGFGAGLFASASIFASYAALSSTGTGGGRTFCMRLVLVAMSARVTSVGKRSANAMA